MALQSSREFYLIYRGSDQNCSLKVVSVELEIYINTNKIENIYLYNLIFERVYACITTTGVVAGLQQQVSRSSIAGNVLLHSSIKRSKVGFAA